MVTDQQWVDFKRRVPLVGAALAYTHDPLEYMTQMYRDQGPVARVPLSLGAQYFVMGADAVGEVLINKNKAYVSGWEWLVGPFFKGGLMLLDGDHHLSHRRILQEAFTRPHLDAYAKLIEPASAALLDAWQPSDHFRVYAALKDLTLELATDIFMGGHRVNPGVDMSVVKQAFVDCVLAAGGLVRAHVPGTRWGRAYEGRKILEDFFREEMPGARAAQADDMFSVLTRVHDETGASFTDEDVIDHMIFLLMAAHDTSTSTVSSAVYLLARYPHWQSRLREQVLGLSRLDDPSLSALDELTWVIQETQRLLPPVPLLARNVARDTELQGVPLKAGSRLGLGNVFNHFQEEHWSEPTTFDPLRFSPERAEHKSHRHAWVPFGAGVHKCLGMHFSTIEVRMLLAGMLQRFEWSIPFDYSMPISNLSLPYPKDDLPIRLRPLRTEERKAA